LRPVLLTQREARRTFIPAFVSAVVGLAFEATPNCLPRLPARCRHSPLLEARETVVRGVFGLDGGDVYVGEVQVSLGGGGHLLAPF
jgi:hypothetical protein